MRSRSVSYGWTIRPANCSPSARGSTAVSTQKTTALGPERFVTIAFEIVDDWGEPVGRMVARPLYFDPRRGRPRVAMGGGPW
jgi:hypothetical protein